MNARYTDKQILHHRTLLQHVLGSDELVTARRRVQELYADQADACRRAAACTRHSGGRAEAPIPEPREAALSDETWAAYERTVRNIDRSGKRIAEADDASKEAFRAWAIADHAYHQRRAELLAASGCDERIAGIELSADRARREAFEQVLLTCPPVGWGMKKYTSPEQRAAAWQTRPAFERRTCLCPRDSTHFVSKGWRDDGSLIVVEAPLPEIKPGVCPRCTLLGCNCPLVNDRCEHCEHCADQVMAS